MDSSLGHMRFNRPPPPNGVPIVGPEMEAAYGPLALISTLTRIRTCTPNTTERPANPAPYLANQLAQLSAIHQGHIFDSGCQSETFFSTSTISFGDSFDNRRFSRSLGGSTCASERGGARSGFVQNPSRANRAEEFPSMGPSGGGFPSSSHRQNPFFMMSDRGFSESCDVRSSYPRFGGNRSMNRGKVGGPSQNKGRRLGSFFGFQQQSKFAQSGGKGFRGRSANPSDLSDTPRFHEKSKIGLRLRQVQPVETVVTSDTEVSGAEEPTDSNGSVEYHKPEMCDRSRPISAVGMVEVETKPPSEIRYPLASSGGVSAGCDVSEEEGEEMSLGMLAEGNTATACGRFPSECSQRTSSRKSGMSSSRSGDSIEECLLSNLPKMVIPSRTDNDLSVEETLSEGIAALSSSHSHSTQQLSSVASAKAEGHRLASASESFPSANIVSSVDVNRFGRFSGRSVSENLHYRDDGCSRQRKYTDDMRLNSGDDLDVLFYNNQQESSFPRDSCWGISDENKGVEFEAINLEGDEVADLTAEVTLRDEQLNRLSCSDSASVQRFESSGKGTSEMLAAEKASTCTEVSVEGANFVDTDSESRADSRDATLATAHGAAHIDYANSDTSNAETAILAAEEEERRYDEHLSPSDSPTSQRAPGWISDDAMLSIVPPELAVGPTVSHYQYEVSKLDILSDDIWSHCISHSQSEIVLNRKLHLRDMLYSVIIAVFPNCGLYVVGSSLNGFGMNSSDMDLCLMITNQELDQLRTAPEVLRQVQQVLAPMSWITDLQLINAKVPILRIRFTPVFDGMVVDLNANNSVAIRNTHLLRNYSAYDWRVRPLVCIVKEWAKRKNINDASQSSFTSYSLVLMVIHYLQCGVKPAVLPSLQALYPAPFHLMADVRSLSVSNVLDMSVWSPNRCSSLGELLVGFLEYYAFKFDYMHDAISVRLGSKLSRETVARQTIRYGGSTEIAQWNCICIEEPFTLTNTALAVHNEMVFEQIKQAFVEGYIELDKNRDLAAFLNVSPINVSVTSSSLRAIQPSNAVVERGDVPEGDANSERFDVPNGERSDVDDEGGELVAGEQAQACASVTNIPKSPESPTRGEVSLNLSKEEVAGSLEVVEHVESPSVTVAKCEAAEGSANVTGEWPKEEFVGNDGEEVEKTPRGSDGNPRKKAKERAASLKGEGERKVGGDKEAEKGNGGSDSPAGSAEAKQPRRRGSLGGARSRRGR